MVSTDVIHTTSGFRAGQQCRNFGYSPSENATEFNNLLNVGYISPQVTMVGHLPGNHDRPALRNDVSLLHKSDDSECFRFRVIYEPLLELLSTDISFGKCKRVNEENPLLTISQNTSNYGVVLDLLWDYWQGTAPWGTRTKETTTNREPMIGRPSLKEVLLAPEARIEGLALPRSRHGQRPPPEF